ncbi:phosphatidylinositol-specific phospholipase C1-like protein [Sphingomonas sp. CBMAI 2297]|uniref:Ca2+-dependent phosphoinositide-specific phospholipase C n=1 Tax=Sphingomonas sp. CBMAI 2297 TaxID=2991720 RepID=UPI002458A543|nr:Ca2+-dependent phosphoinositide-specific phospholipase C [Sphingomonas sp. CBMAI 2297]MDH4745911.1 phosphatidylinositol-specific phospholipase C1-like protein [Sphingomonas sp. CBMAI 2297]
MMRALALLALVAGTGAASAPRGDLRLDQVQLIGSHNSYRPYPSPQLRARLAGAGAAEWAGLAYGHPPLEAQLALGLRQLELDVAPDPAGGAYAAPYGGADAESRRIMAAPGAKVLHIPGFDTETHCLTLRLCLATLRHWSDRHPGHGPVMVLINTGDAGGARFDAGNLAALDADILAEIGRERLVTPDDVRRTLPSLRAAATARRWPSLARAAGRFLFVLDGSTAHEEAYRAGHPSLRGRAMFGFYPEDADEAAVFNIQDPIAEGERIHGLVRAGFIVRTRADVGLKEARAADRRRLDAAIASGAQWISSDLYEGATNPERLAYRAALPGGVLARCDPVTARC